MIYLYTNEYRYMYFFQLYKKTSICLNDTLKNLLRGNKILQSNNLVKANVLTLKVPIHRYNIYVCIRQKLYMNIQIIKKKKYYEYVITIKFKLISHGAPPFFLYYTFVNRGTLNKYVYLLSTRFYLLNY